MSNKPRTERHSGVSAVITSVVLLLAAALLLVFLYRDTAFKPFLQTAILLLLPTGINLFLILLCPGQGRVKRKDGAEASADTPLTRRAALKKRVKRARLALVRLIKKNRAWLTALLFSAFLVLANVFFWRYTRQGNEPIRVSVPLAFYHAILLAALFLLFIVLGKWCKHASPALNAENAANARYELSLLRNLQSALALGRVATLLTAVDVTLYLVGVYDFSRWLVLLLSLLFAYQVIFMAISLFVVLVRRELTLAPEIAAPMLGVESGDLGLLSYLEKNTGITMRSLWSIQLMKRSLPYALLLAVFLLWGATGISLVEAHQEGAHYRMGELREETLAPGLHLTLPWPFDRVEVYDTGTVKQMTVGYVAEGDADNLWTEAHGTEEYRLLLGGGNELVSVNLRIMYRIDDLRAYLTGTASPELLMSSAAYEILTLHTIERDLTALLSTDREQFATELREKLTAHLAPYGTGLAITDVVLESIHPPVEVAEAYQALFSADTQAMQIILNAQTYYIQTTGFAKVQAQDLEAAAKIAGFESVGEATAAVAEFMAAAALDKAYYCNGTVDGEKCDKLMMEVSGEDGRVTYACGNQHTAESALGLEPVSKEYRYYRYIKAISEAYGNAKLIIVGDGVDAGNIYIGGIPANNGGTE